MSPFEINIAGNQFHQLKIPKNVGCKKKIIFGKINKHLLNDIFSHIWHFPVC